MIDPYEVMIQKRIFEIVREDVYMKTTEIIQKPDAVADMVIGELLGDACCGQNISPIIISRKWLSMFPTEWISGKIQKLASQYINITDEWEYRRLLELAEIISPKLLVWAIELADESEDLDIKEAATDFRDKL